MLNWEWNEKIGTATFIQKGGKGEEDSTFEVNLYKGNAFLIMIYEFNENGTDKWQMFGFFLDEYHAKNCLGLNKKEGYTSNIYSDGFQKLIKIRINKRKYKYTKKLITMLVDAFEALEIELFSEED